MTMDEYSEKISEKLALNPHLDAALETAIAGEMPAAGEEPGAQEAQAAALESNANIAGWKTAVVQVVPMVEAMIPEFRQLVKPAQWEAFGQALGETCDYYGFGIGEAFNHPLVKLAVAAFPIGYAGYQIKLAREAAAQQAGSRPAAAPAPVRGEVASSSHPGVTVRTMTADQAPA